jgi:thioredoxin-related protein
MKYMKIKILGTVIAAFLAGGILNSQELTFEQALEKAKAENKKVIVDVYTDWCGWCKKMDRDVYENKSIKKITNKSFIIFKLDAEGNDSIKYNGAGFTETDLAAYFEAQGYPTTVFLEPGGKIIEYKYQNQVMRNIPGYLDAANFKKMLKFVRDEKYKDTDLSTIF